MHYKESPQFRRLRETSPAHKTKKPPQKEWFFVVPKLGIEPRSKV